MKLEKILSSNINRRNALEIIGIDLTSFLLFGCGDDKITGDVDISGDLDITHGTEQTGMVQGKVTVPKIEDNKIAYLGIEGADIEIVETEFKTKSVYDGLYAIDNIPTGSYNIKGSKSWYYPDVKSIIVTRGDLITVSDLKLIPSYFANQILYGKIYDIDKEAPFANKRVSLYTAGWIVDDKPYSQREYVLGEFKGSTTTSSEGSYAFYAGGNWFMLSGKDVKIRFMNPDSPHSGDINGIKERDAYVAEYV